MKRKRLVVLAVAILLLLGITGIAFAIQGQRRAGEPTVVLHCKTPNQYFEFQNVTAYSGNTYPNLFQDALTAMMPGDSKTQTILVRAEGLSGNSYADIFLRAVSKHDTSPSEITEQEAANYALLMQNATVRITRTAQSGAVSTITLPADGERVQLGTFHNEDSVIITVDFGMNREAGNEIANLKAEIGWVFQAEIHEFGGGGGGGIILPPIQDEEPEEEQEEGILDIPLLDTRDHFAYIIGRPDGLLHPEADVTRAEVSAVFFRLLTEENRAYYWSSTNPYSDVYEDSWFNNEVSTLTNAGILYGRPDGTFDGYASITRAEFAAICSRFFLEGEGGMTFPDIEGHWAQQDIELVCANGILFGYPDGTFRPNDAITRAEMVTIVNRLLGRAPHKDLLHPGMTVWPDNMNPDVWYYADMQEATNSHLRTREEGFDYEIWDEVLPPPDWNALEVEWEALYGAQNAALMVDSREASRYE